MTSPPFSSLLSFFMHVNADKGMILGSDRPCGGVPTSFHFPSQRGLFTPGNDEGETGTTRQPDSQIKISPVSERIKTLEALAAKTREPYSTSDGGFSHFRGRNHEKTSSESPKSFIEKSASTVQKKGISVDNKTPESPFEVLRELREVHEFEETGEWMKTHLPPVPDYDIVSLSSNIITKEEGETVMVIPDALGAFSDVPDAFVDSPIESPKLKEKLTASLRHPSVENESEFDHSNLPTASMCEQQEKSDDWNPSNLSSVLPPAPFASFGSPSPVFPPNDKDSKQNMSDDKPVWTEDVEASEVGSSRALDDSVIEDGFSVPPTSSDPVILNDSASIPASAVQNLPTEEKERPPRKSEKKLIQVPTINVIESDEPNYSEEEMEMETDAEEDEHDEIVQGQAQKDPTGPGEESGDCKNELFKRRPLEKEFIEGYSPPSTPVDSDAEYSPKHQKPISPPEAVHQESAYFHSQTDSKDFAPKVSQTESEKSQTSSKKVSDDPSPFMETDEMAFTNNEDKWPEGTQVETTTQSNADEKSNSSPKEASLEGASLFESHFIQEDDYDRQSFDYDVSLPIDDTGLKTADEQFLSSPQNHMEPLNANAAKNNVPENTKTVEEFTLINDEVFSKAVPHPSLTCYTKDPYSSFQSETLSNISEQDFKNKITCTVQDNIASDSSLPGHKSSPDILQDTIAGHHAPDSISSQGTIDPDHSVHQPADSFVEFMQECLKSRQDEKPESFQGVPKKEFCKADLLPSEFPSTMVMDFNEEHLSALEVLSSSQKEEEKKGTASFQDQVNLNESIKQSSYTSSPTSPCSQNNLMIDSTHSKEVEAIDEWVAEAYHLAEHVLTGILFYVSGNISSLWALGLLTSCSTIEGSHFSQCLCCLNCKHQSIYPSIHLQPLI